MPSSLDDQTSIPAAALKGQLACVVFPVHPAQRGEIRECVHSYVDDVKAAGWPPERVVAVLKRVAVDTGIRTTARVMFTAPMITGNDLFADMVGWCIQRYYDCPERTK